MNHIFNIYYKMYQASTAETIATLTVTNASTSYNQELTPWTARDLLRSKHILKKTRLRAEHILKTGTMTSTTFYFLTIGCVHVDLVYARTRTHC